jgi:hypothetical protein
MLSAIRQHEPTNVTRVVIVIYGDNRAYKAFESALMAIEEMPVPEATQVVGEKEFDKAAFIGQVFVRDFGVGNAGGMTTEEAQRMGAQLIHDLLKENDLPVDLERFGRYVTAFKGDRTEMRRIRKIVHPDVVQGLVNKQYGELYEPEILAEMVSYATSEITRYFNLLQLG